MTSSQRPETTWFRRHTQHVRSRPRLMISVLVFAILFAITSTCEFGWARSILLAFDIAACCFLGMSAWMFSHSTTASMRTRAAAEDNDRWSFLFSSIALSAVVLIALFAELQAAGKSDAFEIVLAASSLVLSWLFMNTMFALHYAHGYYSVDQSEAKHRAALEFPGGQDPDYWDFAYFAIVIGMTFQVSDVQIGSRHLRRIALMHSVIAFFFNVVILALSVNLIAGKA